MGSIIFMIIAIVVLSRCTMPKPDLSKKSRHHTSRPRKGMTRFNSIKQKKMKQNRYFRKFGSF